jgi:hypothetical protein
MLLYDHILTITDEYKYVWRAPHSITKDGFLLIRYLVPIVRGVRFVFLLVYLLCPWLQVMVVTLHGKPCRENLEVIQLNVARNVWL